MPFINSTFAQADSIVAASADHENTTTEAVFNKSVTIPAKSLAVGDVIRIRSLVYVSDNNSTDTLTLVLRMGTAGTAADQAIITTAAVDVADADVGYFDVDIVIRTIGASGTMVACGVQGLGVPGTVTAKPFLLGSTAIDTTSAQIVTVSADWSVAHADNECNLEVLNVQVIKNTP